MRLSEFEIETIKNTARKIWGEEAIVYLFGSRIDDSKKGGDIDLYIHLDKEQDPRNLMIKKASFLALLEIQLGEQKIDLLVNTSYNTHLPIIKSAEEKGLAL